jgi:hypothetical protein
MKCYNAHMSNRMKTLFLFSNMLLVPISLIASFMVIASEHGTPTGFVEHLTYIPALYAWLYSPLLVLLGIINAIFPVGRNREKLASMIRNPFIGAYYFIALILFTIFSTLLARIENLLIF